VREIAARAGVDPALINRYFGSKEDLFLIVLDSCETGADLMGGERSTFGDRVAHEAIFKTKSDSKLKGLLILLRSIGSAKAMELVQKTANERFFNPFADWVGGPDAAVRARLASGFIMGMAVSREITGGYGLSPDECERMERRMARILQDIIEG